MHNKLTDRYQQILHTTSTITTGEHLIWIRRADSYITLLYITLIKESSTVHSDDLLCPSDILYSYHCVSYITVWTKSSWLFVLCFVKGQQST